MADGDVDLRESSFITFPPVEMEGESGEFTGNMINSARDAGAHVRARAKYCSCVLSPPETRSELTLNN